MKLLIVTPEYLPVFGGGIVTFYRHLLPELVKRGHEVQVIVGSAMHAAARAAPLDVDGVKVQTLEQDRRTRCWNELSDYAALPSLRGHLAAAWAMKEQMGGGAGFDLVEACDWGLSFVPWVFGDGPPVVVQTHGSVGQIDFHDPGEGEEIAGHLTRLIERSACSRAEAVHALAPANAAFWRAEAGVEVDVLPPSWRAPRDVAAAARHERGLVVGRVQLWKGAETLCKALRQLGADAPAVDWYGRDVPFRRGDGSMAAYLRATYPDVWGPVVKHHAPVSPDEIDRRYAEAAFTVVPSRWDTFNFACVEAMGAATPVICSRGAGVSALIEDGTDGLTFAADDAASLAAAIRKMAGLGPEGRARMGQAGRDLVQRRLDPDACLARRVEAYERVAKMRRARPTHAWLESACRPVARDATLDAALERLPLRDLVRHVLRRTWRKVT